MTQSANAPNPLVGTWKIVSFQFETEGTDQRQSAYDDYPSGFLIITAGGRMMTVITAGGRAPNATPADLFDTMTAYTGRYRLRGDSFITIADSAWHPAWVGADQTWYFIVDGDTLSMKSPFQRHPRYPERRVRGVVVWRKE